MELSPLLHQLQLSPPSSSSSSPDKPLSSHPRPPITEVLSQLREKLIGSDKKASDCEVTALIGQIEQLFRTADPDWLFSPDSTNQSAACLVATYGSLTTAVIGEAVLPLCEPDSGPPPSTATGTSRTGRAQSAPLSAPCWTDWESDGRPLHQNVKTVFQYGNRLILTLKEDNVNVILDNLPKTLTQEAKKYLEKLKQGKQVWKTSHGSAATFSLLGDQSAKDRTNPSGERQ